MESYLSFGNFASFNPQLSTKKRIALNRLIKLIIFFNAFKLVFISLAEWLGHAELKLYLIEILIFHESYQKFLDVAVSIMQMGVFFEFSYWTSLAVKAGTLESFSFLMITDAKNLCPHKRYHLDKPLTDRYLLMYRICGFLLKLFVPAYYLFVLTALLRCLYRSFEAVSLVFFLSVGLLLFVITAAAYLILTAFVISKFTLVLLSTEFLIVRLKAINILMFKRFVRTKPDLIGRPIKLRKQKAITLKTLHLLNDFCRQFKQINSVLDSSLSMVMLMVFVIIFLLPYFLIFVQGEPGIRLSFSVLAVAAYLFCFSFSICNDRLQRQVGKLMNFVNNQVQLTTGSNRIGFFSLDQIVE